MGLHRTYEEQTSIPDMDYNFDDAVDISIEEEQHKKEVRRLLEERLEQKRLKEILSDDIDEWDMD